MKAIDEQRLETDLQYRFEYLAEFIGFDSEDIAAIHSAGPKLFSLIPGLVDATYDKLLSYDATGRHFVPRQEGFDGPLPVDIEELTHETEQIKFRKEHLKRYLMNVVGNAYDAKMINYLDIVGKMHTPKAGNKNLDVPLVQMNALMGFISDALIKTIFKLGLEREQEILILTAFNKLLWIQNDLITRHYNEQLIETG